MIENVLFIEWDIMSVPIRTIVIFTIIRIKTEVIYKNFIKKAKMVIYTSNCIIIGRMTTFAAR